MKQRREREEVGGKEKNTGKNLKKHNIRKRDRE